MNMVGKWRSIHLLVLCVVAVATTACSRRAPEEPFDSDRIESESVDVRDPEATAAWLARCAVGSGGIDVLVNNAGGAPAVASAEAPPKLMNKILELNLARRPLAGDVDLELLADMMERYSGADVKNVCEKAAADVFLKAVKSGAEGDAPPIALSDLEEVLRETRPSVSAADLDGDGDVDLVAPYESGNSVLVILNTGGGVMQAPVTYPVGVTPTAVLALDRDQEKLAERWESWCDGSADWLRALCSPEGESEER